jgi:hypothetical protein
MRRHNVVMTAGSCGIAALAIGLVPATAQAAQAAHPPHAKHAAHAKNPKHTARTARKAHGTRAARAARAPGWRIVHVNGYADHDSLTAVAAVSQRDAWAGGLANSAGSHAFLQHWDGQTWSRVSLPAAVRKISYGQISGLAASSASNVWAFISGHPAAVARFNGTSWQVMREWPGEGFSITGATFGPRDVWMFGGIGPQTAGTWHYNGRRWSRPKMPLTAFGVSRVSARDEWAIGERLTGRGGYAGGVEHWNGHSWRTAATGGLVPADTATRSTALGQVFAQSRRSVWVTGTTYTGGFRHLRSFVLHWNGRKWRRLTGRGDVSLGPAIIAGGRVQAVSQQVKLTNQSYIDPAPAVVSAAARRWITLAMPRHPGRSLEINGMAAIPGTQSAWAVGGYFTDNTVKGWVPVDGVILRRGS